MGRQNTSIEASDSVSRLGSVWYDAESESVYLIDDSTGNIICEITSDGAVLVQSDDKVFDGGTSTDVRDSFIMDGDDYDE